MSAHDHDSHEPTMHEPTMHLRFIKTRRPGSAPKAPPIRILQQLFVPKADAKGWPEPEWRDVPLERER